MTKFNFLTAISLAVVSMLAVVANYFNVFAVPTLWVNVTLSVIVSIFAFLQVWYYSEFEDQNPLRFWLGYSTIIGMIIIGVLFASGSNAIQENLGVSMLTGLTPGLFPIMGVVFGNYGRVVFEKETSLI